MWAHPNKMPPRCHWPREMRCPAWCRFSLLPRRCHRRTSAPRAYVGHTLMSCACRGGRHCGYRPARMGGDYSLPSKLASVSGGCDRRMAVVLCQCHRWVSCRGLHMTSLFSCSRNVAFPRDRKLCWSWSRPHSARAAVVAYPRPVPVNDRLVIDVCDDVGDVVHSRIVEKRAVVPVTAFVAVPSVTEAVIYTSVEADFRRPIAVVEHIFAITVGPVGGRP